MAQNCGIDFSPENLNINTFLHSKPFHIPLFTCNMLVCKIMASHLINCNMLICICTYLYIYMCVCLYVQVYTYIFLSITSSVCIKGLVCTFSGLSIWYCITDSCTLSWGRLVFLIRMNQRNKMSVSITVKGEMLTNQIIRSL